MNNEIDAAGNPEYFDKRYWGEEGPTTMVQFFKQFLTHRGILTSNYIKGSYDAYDNDGFWNEETTALQKYLPRESKIAEIGCGYGHLQKRLILLFSQVYGLDISPTALDVARKRIHEALPKSEPYLIQMRLGGIGAVAKEWTGIPFKDESLDGIVAMDTIEHVSWIKEPQANEPQSSKLQKVFSDVQKRFPQSVRQTPDGRNQLPGYIVGIAEIGRTLRKDGIAVVGVPTKDTLAGRIWQLVDVDKSHVSIPTQKGIEEAFAQLGFKILEKKPYFPYPDKKRPFPPTNTFYVVKKTGEISYSPNPS